MTHKLHPTARFRDDFVFFAGKCLRVRAKDGKIVPLELNAAQRHIHAKVEEQLEKTGRVRALVLKGRQQGCSTYVQARFYWKVTHNRGQRAFILTHLEDASRNIYGIAKRFFDNCPEDFRPQATLSNRREMAFGGLDSGYHVATARSSGVGRSDTVQFFHGSEVAYWQNAREHVFGVFQSVPETDNTEIILESTSAGRQGFFFEMCEAARNRESDYIFIFTPWFWQQEYRKTPPAGFVPAPDEAAEMQEHGLDAAQVYWRRGKIAELGAIEAFRREYPATPDEAFAADRQGALWTRAVIERNRVSGKELPEFSRIVVAIDPAVTSNPRSDETGIIVAGVTEARHVYVLEDLSGRHSPAEWASVAIDAYYRFEAACVVAETNQGGEMVEYTLKSIDPLVAFKSVRASKGKFARAEPVAALDARGMVHHAGRLQRLEDQMCAFDPLNMAVSPDRVDARVWAVTELMLQRAVPAGPRMWR